MAYTQEAGRKFWHDFEKHFRNDAAANGLVPVYQALGGDDAAANAWLAGPEAFEGFTRDKEAAIRSLAGEQERFIKEALPNDDDIVSAFQDFAFGLLESSDAPHRVSANDTRHTMTGGKDTDGYLHWHGFIEAARLLGQDPAFWSLMRSANGMAAELHAKAHPGDGDDYAPLPANETAQIRDKWFRASDEDFRQAFAG